MIACGGAPTITLALRDWMLLNQTGCCALYFAQARCQARHLLPYFVPVGGFMLTPRYDDDVEALERAVHLMAECALETTRQMGWSADVLVASR